MPWPLTVEPTAMEAATASEGSARVLAPTAALVTVTLTLCAMVYVGVSVGDTVGALLGDALGMGVGTP